MISFIPPTLRSLEAATAETVVFFSFEEIRPLCGLLSKVDWRLHGHLSKMMIERFFTGKKAESLLVLPGRKLAVPFLLWVGLGPRKCFDDTVFREVLAFTFETQKRLRAQRLAALLPGRIESLIPAEQAVERLITAYEPHLETVEGLTLIEPPAAQKEMTPALERWRLRRLIPGFGVA